MTRTPWTIWRGEHELSLEEAERVTREDLAAIVTLVRRIETAAVERR
jgi:hypothetical protein